MTFGIYPGGVAGTDTGLTNSKPDNPVLIQQALGQLQQHNQNLIIRGYIHYNGSTDTGEEAPEKVEQYITNNNTLDLVVCYRSPELDEAVWTDVIKKIIHRYGKKLNSVQITEEPNLKTAFAGDGCFKNIERALFTGLIAAKQEILNCELPVKVGFNTILSFGPEDSFWNTIGSEAFTPLRDAIDYVGLDFFPDVFRPVAADGEQNDLKQSITNVLRYFRYERLAKNGIPLSVLIHISENGWPTGKERTYERQAEVIEKIISTVYSLKDELNVTQYELFSLRDADSDNQDLFYQFGLLRDDNTRKPAFETFKELIQQYQ